MNSLTSNTASSPATNTSDDSPASLLDTPAQPLVPPQPDDLLEPAGNSGGKGG